MSLNYQTEVEINVPRNRVVELFVNPDNLYKWMEGLIEFKHLSGTPNTVGAKSEFHFVMGKRDVRMQEEILELNFPQGFTSLYTMPGVDNRIVNTFVEHGSSTIWGMDNQFIFQGFGMKMMSKLMPGMFKKQTMKNMQAFKDFAESAG